jgi:hypothetical protein
MLCASALDSSSKLAILQPICVSVSSSSRISLLNVTVMLFVLTAYNKSLFLLWAGFKLHAYPTQLPHITALTLRSITERKSVITTLNSS